MSKKEFKATRRDLIKYSMFLGAALGLPRWKVFEALEGSSSEGKAMAAEAACAVTNRSVHIIAGNGALSWFQLLWPHNDVAAAAAGGNTTVAFHAGGDPNTIMPQGTDKPLTLSPQAPWRALPAARQVSALMGGSNQTHTQAPTSNTGLGNANGLFAAAAALQATSPTLVPVIAVGGAAYGTAAGAPRSAAVSNAAGMVGLFNSAASQTGGALANPQDAALFQAAYKGFLALNAAAGKSSTASSLGTGKQAAELLGRNLASVLTPSTTDLARYGITATSPTKLVEFAKTLATTAKAFTGGFTNMVVMNAFDDDPHGAFSDMNNLKMMVTGIGAALQAFQDDLQTSDPTCAGTKIFDNTVLSIHGDTPKTPLNQSGWPDGTPSNSNWIYALGAGWLKSGWFGGIDRTGKVTTWDPSSGADSTTITSTTLGMPAAAAVLYAVARGDARRVGDFFTGQYQGVTRAVQM